NDLNDVMAGKKSVVFIDSQGDMLQKILHLAELTPSRPQEVKQQELPPVNAEPQEKVPETLPEKRTGMRRFWHIVGVLLVNLLVIAAFFIIAVFVQAIYWDGKDENITLGSILLGFGLLTGAW